MKLIFDFRYIHLGNEAYRFTLVFIGAKNGEFVHLMMTGGSEETIQTMFQTSGKFELTDEEIRHVVSREHRFQTIEGLKEKFISYLK